MAIKFEKALILKIYAVRNFACLKLVTERVIGSIAKIIPFSHRKFALIVDLKIP